MDFDKNRVYTSLNADEVKIGSVGYFADDLATLMNLVRTDNTCNLNELERVSEPDALYRFKCKKGFTLSWNLFYLVEEVSDEDLCTEQELTRWLGQGKGLFKDCVDICSCGYCFRDGEEDKSVGKHIRVRKWEDKDWHIPTREYMGIK